MPLVYVMSVKVGDNVSRVKSVGKEKNLLKLSKYAVKMNTEKALKLYTEVLL